MKKTLLAFLVISLLVVPFLSNTAQASVYEMTEYDTGIRAEAPEDRVNLTWEFDACWYAWYYGVAEIEYKQTTPKNAAPEDDAFENPELGGYWEDDVWYGWVEFDSHIKDGAKRGTNHGHITITFSNGYPQVLEWSFNVRHS
ncbi:MAG: hypothetical protein LN417_02595 [Candidatus Thermoplasmatota archaeon]|nr:hypothetical protein [Candidatus Thermoplasmatota archaeon]